MDCNRTCISIKYDKTTGEYTIKKRDHVTGKTILYYANGLTYSERTFATTCKKYEIDNLVIWTK